MMLHKIGRFGSGHISVVRLFCVYFLMRSCVRCGTSATCLAMLSINREQSDSIHDPSAHKHVLVLSWSQEWFIQIPCPEQWDCLQVQSPNTIRIVSRNYMNQSGEAGVGANLYGVVLGLTNTVVLAGVLAF